MYQTNRQVLAPKLHILQVSAEASIGSWVELFRINLVGERDKHGERFSMTTIEIGAIDPFQNVWTEFGPSQQEIAQVSDAFDFRAIVHGHTGFNLSHENRLKQSAGALP